MFNLFEKVADHTTKIFSLAIGNPVSLLLTGGLLISIYAVGLPENSSFTSYKLLLVIFKDIGIAFIISAAAILTFEHIAEQRRQGFLDEMTNHAKDQIDQMAGAPIENYLRGNMPPNFFDFLSKELSKFNFLRQNLNIRFSISNDANGVMLVTRTEFTVKNLSKKASHYDIETFVEYPYSDQFRERAKVTQVLVNGDPLSAAEMAAADKMRANTPTHYRFCHSIPLLPDQEASICVRTETPRLETDRFVWLTSGPSAGITAELEVEDGLQGFLSVFHSDCNNTITKKVLGGMVTVSTKEPVMPLVGVEAAWVPEKFVGKQYVE